jgi:cysteinyl-tRNA synthetase
VNIDDEVAYDMARRLAREEGLFVGMSSGAAMAIALKKAAELASGTVVVILPDGGERYLSTALFAVREKISLQVHNALGRQKEGFQTLAPGKAGVYTCGPTAHARPDLGECRRFITADIVCRYLAVRGFDVAHAMNVTDLDDNTIAGSEAARQDIAEYTAAHLAGILEDFAALGIKPPSKMPKTSENLDQMLRIGRRLAEKGVAYEKLRSLYFNISKAQGYGELSGMDPEKIRPGATVDLDGYEKENPRDFTLFKRSRLSDLKRGIYVKSDWGNVLPSWNIQGVAMAMACLGENFDLHISSRDLAFPHHENELAISRALTGKPLARYWLQCDRVYVDGKRMGAGAPRVTVDDILLKGTTGRELRYFLLSRDYKRPLPLDEAGLENAKAAKRRLDRFAQSLALCQGGAPVKELDQILYDMRQGFNAAMDDDFDVPAALAAVFAGIKRLNPLVASGGVDKAGAAKILDLLRKHDEVLGVMDFAPPGLDKRVEALSREREEARAARDYARADALREELRALGVEVRDGKGGE